MSAFAHWDEAEWSKLTLGTRVLPGAWEVEGEVARKVDIKEQKDRDGATIKDQGYSNADVTLIGTISTLDDWETLDKALKEIHPRRKGAAREPLAVVHPALAILGINNVYVLGIGAPQLNADGIVSVRIRCLEWLPASKATGKSKGKPLNTNWKPGDALNLLGNGIPPRDSALAYLQLEPSGP